MNNLSNWLTAIAYSILAASLGLAAFETGTLSLEISIVAAGAAFLICAQSHAAINRARDRKVLGREIEFLSRGNAILSEELEVLRDQTTEIVDTFEAQSQQRSNKVVAEVRVLETLIRQLAEEVEGKAQAAAIATIEKLGNSKKSSTSSTDPVGKMIGAIENAMADATDQNSENKSYPDRGASGSFSDIMPETELLDVIRASLENNRVDLYLQPIVTLPQRRVRFYEALSRLRSREGTVIMPSQYLRVAEPAGLMSVIDNLLLFRCVQIVRKLSDLNKDVGIFCNISQNSLMDREFFPQFLEFMGYNTDLVPFLMFEFAQDTIEDSSAVERANLDQLAEMGFRFSIDKVTDLNMDLPDLRHRNFRYIKVPIDVFLSEVIEDKRDFRAADFKDLIARFGIDLIIERVESESELIETLEYDVEYAQGFLFGKPRPLEEVEARIEASQDRMGTDPAPNWRPIAYLGSDDKKAAG